MITKKPPGKRLTSLFLTLALLLTLVPAMGTTAAAANAAPSKVAVTINGTSISLDSGDYVETNSSSDKKTHATTEPTGYVAWYHDGVLTLNGYDGGSISTSSVMAADATIKLKGTNKVTVDNTAYSSSSEGILHDGGGDLTITGDSGSTLKIDVAGGGNVYAIVTNYSAVGSFDGTVTIGGSAEVSIHAKTTAAAGKRAYGIYVPGGVTIREDASLDVTCETNCSSNIAQDAPKMGAGILTSPDGTKFLTIDTSGSVRLDFSKADSAYSTYALQTPTVILTRGRLEMFWKLSDSTDPYGTTSTVTGGTDAGTYAAREKKDVSGKKGAAVFVSGTPHTLKLVNAWDAAWAVSSANEVQYVVGEEVTLKPLSIEGVSHTGWKSEDVSISGNAFTMPDNDVTVEGLYEVFAQQPGFKRTYETASNNSGTISFKLNGSPTATQTALVHENSDDVVLYLNTVLDTGASVDQGKWVCNVSNSGTTYGVPPSRYRVRVEYDNHTFYSDVFTVKYAAPAASVDADVTVSGSAGTAITNTDVVVTLQNDTFASTLSGDWISNLPIGLSQSVTRTNDTTAKITISGTPLVGSTEDMRITIPAGALAEESGTSVLVSISGRAKFAITSNAPTADKIQIGDGSNNKFSADKLYYKNGENGAKGTFSDNPSGYNAKYDPATGTLTLNGYDGPYIRINGDASQTVTVKLVGGTNNTVKGSYDPAIQLADNVNLFITSDEAANLKLDVTDENGVGTPRGSNNTGSVTIMGKATVAINVSLIGQSYSGIRGGGNVAVLGDASLKITCSSDGGTIKGYGIYAPSGKVTVDTTGTVDIDVSECANSDTKCIYASSIEFKNAEKIMLKYVPKSAGWSLSQPTYGTLDASSMKSSTTPTDVVADQLTTVTYVPKGPPPAAPTISAYSLTFDRLQEVTLTCATSGTVIYYTTDGSDPTDSSTRTQYSESFYVRQSCTLKAVAYSAEDKQYSAVAEAVFTRKPVSITVVGGGKAYSDPERTIEITQAEPGTTVYLKAPPETDDGTKVFSDWSSTATITNKESCDSAFFVMPATQPTITASYKPKPAGVTVSGTAVSWNDTDNAVFLLYDSSTSDTDIKADMKLASPEKALAYTAAKGGVAQNADGKRYDQTFSFSTVPAGTYKLVIYKPIHGIWIETIVLDSSDITDKNLDLYMLGDVNKDGKINNTDALWVRQCSAGSRILDSYQTILADVNWDNKVNNTDALWIRQISAGSRILSY